MKNLIFILTSAMLTARLPAAPVSLAISELSDGSLQIITSGIQGSVTHEVQCVLQATPDLVNWTAISTNHGPFPSVNGMATNVVYATNAMKFYRVYVK